MKETPSTDVSLADMFSQEETHDEPKKEQYDEESLVLRLQSGDTDALAEVLAVHGSNVEEVLRARFQPALADQDIDEAITEGLFALWRTRSRIRVSNGTLGGWFYVICRNIAINKLKRKNRDPTGQCSELIEGQIMPGPVPDASEISGSQQFLVRKIVSELMPVDQAIVHAFVSSYGDKSWTQGLTEQFGMTPNHIRVRWTRIQKLIKKRMTECMEERLSND